jgi:replication fork protection complex subunit Csm3/Swi3
MRDAKRFKVRGKGHEVSRRPRGVLIVKSDANVQAQDLKSLLSTYQIWAHRMFPRGDFMGTMNRVENVLRTRRMEVSPGSFRYNVSFDLISLHSYT